MILYSYAYTIIRIYWGIPSTCLWSSHPSIDQYSRKQSIPVTLIIWTIGACVILISRFIYGVFAGFIRVFASTKLQVISRDIKGRVGRVGSGCRLEGGSYSFLQLDCLVVRIIHWNYSNPLVLYVISSKVPFFISKWPIPHIFLYSKTLKYYIFAFLHSLYVLQSYWQLFLANRNLLGTI